MCVGACVRGYSISSLCTSNVGIEPTVTTPETDRQRVSFRFFSRLIIFFLRFFALLFDFTFQLSGAAGASPSILSAEPNHVLSISCLGSSEFGCVTSYIASNPFINIRIGLNTETQTANGDRKNRRPDNMIMNRSSLI